MNFYETVFGLSFIVIIYNRILILIFFNSQSTNSNRTLFSQIHPSAKCLLVVQHSFVDYYHMLCRVLGPTLKSTMFKEGHHSTGLFLEKVYVLKYAEQDNLFDFNKWMYTHHHQVEQIVQSQTRAIDLPYCSVNRSISTKHNRIAHLRQDWLVAEF